MHYIQAKQILSPGNGMNLCRGCLHGCIYCDARSLCYQMDHPFEDIAIKENALPLLEQALKARRQRCMIGTGAMTDPYLPLPEARALTRGALELIAKYGFGVTIQTKSAAILRDLDLLTQINRQAKAVVQMTLTTCDDALCRILEPNVSVTSQRIAALNRFRDAGIPTVVWLSPILPFLNDTRENLEGLLNACAEARVQGILCFGIGLTLREGNREYFYAQLDRHFPGMKQRYIRQFGNQYVCPSPNEAALLRLYHTFCQSHGILHDPDAIFRWMRTFEDRTAPAQLSFF